MTARRARIAVAVVSALLVGVATVPSRADTASDLKATKAKLAALQVQLDSLATGYADALAALARSQEEMQALAAQLERLQAKMRGIRRRLSARAREIYEGGGANALELLLSSQSLAQFSDRAEFVGTLMRADGDLLIQAKVTTRSLQRTQTDLDRLSAKQAATVQTLRRTQADLESRLAEAQALQASLQKKLARERAATASAPITSNGALQACPVGQPRTFVDTFGAPRPGGRTHQGIDLMAPYGTPIYAAQTGRFEPNSNSLGGTSALVYAPGGDYTYYAHMSSYAGVSSGSTVTAGTMIGHVGNTGDAMGGPYHLHFEYHPGGGSAVDPYGLLRAACG